MTTKTSHLASRLVPVAVVTIGALSVAACGGNSVSTPAATTAGGGSSASSTACPTGKLVGAGSTAQQLAVQTITAAYKTQCPGADVEYSGTGSGAGIQSFISKQTDWAGSDSPLSSTKNSSGIVETEATAKSCGAPAWDLPMVVGPIAYAYNIKGVSKLVLTPDVIASIFMGKITTWNDPAITKLNPGTTLPSEKINVFFRSDSSGTSDNVSKFLHAAAPKVWTAEHNKQWTGTAGEGKKGSQGVATGVKGIEGGFGYMEWKFATDSQLGVTEIDNGAGAVQLTPDSVSKAAAAATNAGTGNDMPLKLKYTDTGAGVYPSVLVTYEIVCSVNSDASKTAMLKGFLNYMASPAVQASLVDQGYAPLPTELQTKVQTAINAIK